MAEAANTTATAVWHDLLTHRAELIHNQNHTPDHDLDEQLVEVVEQLLDFAAPDLAGVVIKLQLLWDGQLHGQDQDSEHKLAVLADLNRLAA